MISVEGLGFTDADAKRYSENIKKEVSFRNRVDIFIKPLEPFLEAIKDAIRMDPEVDYSHMYTRFSLDNVYTKVVYTPSGVEFIPGIHTPYADTFISGQPPRSVPLETLKDWVRVKFGSEDAGLARQVQVKIAEFGSTPYPIVEDAWEKHKDAYYRAVQNELDKI